MNLNRLKQPSTWLGLAGVLLSLLISKGQVDAATATALTNAIGLIVADA